MFGKAYEKDMFISIDMADGDAQVDELQKLIDEYPNIKAARKE